MLKTISVAIHGFSGQGVETAINALAKAAVISGMSSQSVFFPSHERRGTPVWGMVKIDKSGILSKQVEPADFALVFDSAIDQKSVLASSKEGSSIIFNTAQKLNTQPMKKKRIKTFSLDASALLAQSKKNLPNLVMLGAFVKIYGKMPLKSVKQSVDMDTNAVDEGFKNVKQVK